MEIDRIRFVPEGNLFRIVANKDFVNHGSTISSGSKGGLVSSHRNIVQKGSSWIEENAQVLDDSTITHNAVVAGNAVVKGASIISDDAVIEDNAVVINGFVSSFATVSDDAVVSGTVTGSSIIKWNAKVRSGASVSGSSIVSGEIKKGVTVESSFVGSDAVVSGNIILKDNTAIGASISNTQPNALIINHATIDNENDYLFIPRLNFLDGDSILFFKDKHGGWKYSLTPSSPSPVSAAFTGISINNIKKLYCLKGNNIFSNILSKKEELDVGKKLYLNFLKLMLPLIEGVSKGPEAFYELSPFSSKMKILFTILALNCVFLYDNLEICAPPEKMHAEAFYNSCNIDISNGRIVDVSDTVLANKKIIDAFLDNFVDGPTKKRLFNQLKKEKRYIPMQI